MFTVIFLAAGAVVLVGTGVAIGLSMDTEQQHDAQQAAVRERIRLNQERSQLETLYCSLRTSHDSPAGARPPDDANATPRLPRTERT
jgi:hypothetical protein